MPSPVYKLYIYNLTKANIQMEESMEPPVSAAEVAEIQLRLANISSTLHDNDMQEDDEFQVKQIA